jgi:hypothetical protein
LNPNNGNEKETFAASGHDARAGEHIFFASNSHLSDPARKELTPIRHQISF